MDEAQVDTLTIGDHGQVLFVEFEDRGDAIRLRALLEGEDSAAIPVQLALAPDAEVEGHAALDSVAMTLILDDDDTEGHAINVHLSAEEIDVYIACGDVAGTPDGGRLQIDLEELNNSGYQGMAWLMDNGDGTTTVNAVLMQSDRMATPEATPSS